MRALLLTPETACQPTRSTDSRRYGRPPGSVSRLTLALDNGPIQYGVRAGTKSLAMFGCFAYRTYGVAHHTAWCYYYEPGVSNIESLNICQGGKYAD